ncbi:integrase core domain-containing protein [Salipiger aestuarii]
MPAAERHGRALHPDVEGYRHHFESKQHATRVIADWIAFYNTRRPHQALAMCTPAEAFRLAP